MERATQLLARLASLHAPKATASHNLRGKTESKRRSDLFICFVNLIPKKRKCPQVPMGKEVRITLDMLSSQKITSLSRTVLVDSHSWMIVRNCTTLECCNRPQLINRNRAGDPEALRLKMTSHSCQPVLL